MMPSAAYASFDVPNGLNWCQPSRAGDRAMRFWLVCVLVRGQSKSCSLTKGTMCSAVQFAFAMIKINNSADAGHGDDDDNINANSNIAYARYVRDSARTHTHILSVIILHERYVSEYLRRAIVRRLFSHFLLVALAVT